MEPHPSAVSDRQSEFRVLRDAYESAFRRIAVAVRTHDDVECAFASYRATRNQLAKHLMSNRKKASRRQAAA